VLMLQEPRHRADTPEFVDDPLGGRLVHVRDTYTVRVSCQTWNV
jgi:hypothetical protein